MSGLGIMGFSLDLADVSLLYRASFYFFFSDNFSVWRSFVVTVSYILDLVDCIPVVVLILFSLLHVCFNLL